MFKMCCGECGECWWVGNPRACKCPDEEPKRKWVGLTDEEMQNCLNGLPTQTIDVYARRIEAKLKEKNT